MNGRTNPREGEYYDYLNQHISGVQMAWEQFLAPVVEELYPDEYVECCKAVAEHDASKYSADEFDAYCDYFYPSEGYPKDQNAFDRAWLHHQNLNPHHWQYWILIRDEGQLVPMDMPLSEIIGMVCDWHAFSLRDRESTAAKWYEQNKDKMILSDLTREMVVFLLQYLTKPIAR